MSRRFAPKLWRSKNVNLTASIHLCLCICRFSIITFNIILFLRFVSVYRRSAAGNCCIWRFKRIKLFFIYKTVNFCTNTVSLYMKGFMLLSPLLKLFARTFSFLSVEVSLFELETMSHRPRLVLEKLSNRTRRFLHTKNK